jgi:hypothetical protein
MKKQHDCGVMERKLIEFNENNIIQAHFFANPGLTAAQKTILIDMRKGNPNALAEADIVLPRDKEFLLQAVKYNPAALLIALVKTENLQFFRENIDFIRNAVENTVLLFEIGYSWEMINIFKELAEKLPAMQEICLIIGGFTTSCIDSHSRRPLSSGGNSGV